MANQLADLIRMPSAFETLAPKPFETPAASHSNEYSIIN